MAYEPLPVSIHAPAGGATVQASAEAVGKKFQFTLPRGERLAEPWYEADETLVSIHAPAGGATQPRREAASEEGFNSRSRGGSDSQNRGRGSRDSCFNSRSRGGSDSRRFRSSISVSSFNSRSRGGSD